MGPESLERGGYSKLAELAIFGHFSKDRAKQNREKRQKLSRMQKAFFKKQSLRERKKIEAFHLAIFGHFVNGYSKKK